VATISPSVDNLRGRIGEMLYGLEGFADDPEECLEFIKDRLESAWEYLSVFNPADDVLIPAFTRIEGNIGTKRAIGEFDASDFSYRTIDDSAGTLLGEPGNSDPMSTWRAVKDVRFKV